MMADSSTATISHSVEDGGSGVNSPSGRRTLPFPWAQAVRRGSEPDLISSSPPLSPRVSERNQVSDPVTAPAPAETQPENCNAGDVKRSPWNRPSANGVMEGTSSPVMGAASWPALSESTRPGMKSSLSESSSNLISDGSADISPAPVISQPPPIPKQFKPNSNPNPNPNSNHFHQRQQRPVRRGGANSGYNRPLAPPLPQPMPPPFPVFDMYANLPPPPPQPPFKGNNWSPRPVVSDRNQTRRNNFNHNNGGRRDHHDRDWRGPRNPQMGPPPPPPVRGFIRPPFIPHQPLRPPFGAPMGYDMGGSYVYVPTLAPEAYRGGPPPPPPPLPMFMQNVDPFLVASILQQIEYYFSDENLVKDKFLKSRMDEEGWVPITLIAGFHRVKLLTNDIQLIITSLRDSTIVEIQGDKLRRRTDWKKWIPLPVEEEASLQKLTLQDENGEVSNEQLSS